MQLNRAEEAEMLRDRLDRETRQTNLDPAQIADSLSLRDAAAQTDTNLMANIAKLELARQKAKKKKKK